MSFHMLCYSLELLLDSSATLTQFRERKRGVKLYKSDPPNKTGKKDRGGKEESL